MNSGLTRRRGVVTDDRSSNPILDYARDDYSRGCDVWGFAIAWQFAVAEFLTTLDEPVPTEWEYHSSAFGVDESAPEYQAILDATRSLPDRDVAEYLNHAGKVFDRLREQCELAGLSY